MTDYEFTQIMRDAGYEVTVHSATIWKYKKLPDCFCLEENKKKDSLKFNEESRTCESFKQQCELFSESTVNDIIKNKLNGEYVFICEDLTE